MKKAIRLLVAVAMLAAIAFVAPPASANHHNGTPDLPNADTRGTPRAAGGWHEKPPLPAVAERAEDCVVDGEIVAGNAAAQGTDHTIPPAGNDARHSHYEFLTTTIECGGQSLRVFADGGNDGHDFAETSPDPQHLHAFNGHHGSTNDSGWSHSSFYNGPGGPGGSHSNDCEGVANYNKGDITIPLAGDSKGWVKYLRVGTVINAWGCFYDTSDPDIGANPFFSVELGILPNTGSGAFPDCVVPEVTTPEVTVPDPVDTTVTPTTLTPPPPSCGFTIDGVGVRGPAWERDTTDVHDALEMLP